MRSDYLVFEIFSETYTRVSQVGIAHGIHSGIEEERGFVHFIKFYKFWA